MIWPGDTFSWRGRELPYLAHPYNSTLSNERAIEVPIALDWLAGRSPLGLEVGNVLGHYGRSGHRVVDLYEQAEGVENINLFHAEGCYPWVLCLSTLEHVGWEGPPWEPAAPIHAVRHLLGLVESGGALLASVPFGQHAYLDGAILSGGLAPTRWATVAYEDGRWQVHDGEARWSPARPERWASAVWVAEWEVAA